MLAFVLCPRLYCSLSLNPMNPAPNSIAERWHAPQTSIGEVFVVAHRGAFIHAQKIVAPENSLTAIERARRLGCDAVELDIHATKDGTILVMHDATLNRTSTGNGDIADTNYADLKGVRLRDAESGAALQERPPALEEALAAVGDVMMVNLDCKAGLEWLPRICEVARESGLGKRVTLKKHRLGRGERKRAADILAESGEGVDFIPVLRDSESSLEELAEALEMFAPSCVECLVDSPPGLRGYPAYERMHISADGGGLFSLEARRLFARHGVRQFINTLYHCPETGGSGDGISRQWNGGRNCQLALVAPDLVFSFWIAHGASVIQTDEPAFLLEWLRDGGFRPPLTSAREWSAMGETLKETG